MEDGRSIGKRRWTIGADASSGELTGGGIVARLWEKAKRRKDILALSGNRACWRARWTYGELFAEAAKLAAGLIDLGIRPGERVGLIGENCDAWILSDLALLSIGAIDVPRGGDASADEVSFCVGHAECTAAIVESAAQVAKLESVRGTLRTILIQKGEAPPGTLSMASVIERGAKLLSQDAACVTRRLAAVSDSDVATIIYTSGTTGNPKGVMLTHANILHNVAFVPTLLDLKERQRFLSFLPSWHSFERTIDYVVLDSGMELHYSSKWTVREDFQKVSPHFVCGVPRLWETYYNNVIGGISKLTGWKRRLIDGSLNGSRIGIAAYRRARGLVADERGVVAPPPLLRKLCEFTTAFLFLPAHLLANLLVYSKLRRAFGGKIGAMISGGGALPAHVDEFYSRAGLKLLNGYGLTESSPVISVRSPKRNILGTIGRPISETDVRILGEAGESLKPGQKGVICAKGPQIMRGYYKNPSASEAALTKDGWLNTGDIGMLSTAGDLMITGRAKDTIVLMGGENVEPEPIETAITSSPYVADAILVGHGQKVLGALLVPDIAVLRTTWGIDKTVSDNDVLKDPRTEPLLRSEVATRISKSRGYRNFELVGRINILPRPFSVDDGTLTATMKKRRNVIEERYADTIRAFYAE